MTSKQLWDDAYLDRFAKSLHDGCPTQFWSYNKDGELEDLKAKQIRKLMQKFFPAIGIHNLHVQLTKNGQSLSKTQPVFKRGCLIEEIDGDTIHTITIRILQRMAQPLGDDLVGLFVGQFEKVFSDNALKGLPVLPNLDPSLDDLLTCSRYFRNGWIQITKDGVSELKDYKDIGDNVIVWNHAVIDRDYIADDKSKEQKLNDAKKDYQAGIQKKTGDQSQGGSKKSALLANFDQQNIVEKLERSLNAAPDTHFRDFVKNICSDDYDDEGKPIVNKEALENVELAIGYLCHRFNKDSNRRFIVFVDKFYDGLDGETSNGGTGKSLLVKCLGSVMNLVEISGRTITSKAQNGNMWSRVNRANELVLIDDCSKQFPTELLLTNTTGDFHIKGKYAKDYAIPAKHAPKIVLTSNFPLKGKGNTFDRRQFICEVSNFYLIQAQEFDENPNTLHGHKDFCQDGVGGWNENDWSEFYKYVFECVSKYLAKGGLPKSNESDYYLRAKLVEMVGNSELFDYLLKRLTEYHQSGEEVFTQKFYADVRSNFPTETMEIKDGTFYAWIKEIGKSFKMYVNRSTHGKQKLERLKTKSSDARWKKWIADGMKGTKDNTGKVITEDDRVYVFKVSSPKRPNGSFYSQPNFNKGNP